MGIDQAPDGCGIAAQLGLQGIYPATPHLEVIPYPCPILTVNCTLLNSVRLGVELRDQSMVRKPDVIHGFEVRIRIKIVCHVVD